MGTHPIFESDFDCLTEMDEEFSSSSDEVEEEPKLKYRRLANDMLELLRQDSIAAFLAHERKHKFATAVKCCSATTTETLFKT